MKQRKTEDGKPEGTKVVRHAEEDFFNEFSDTDKQRPQVQLEAEGDKTFTGNSLQNKSLMRRTKTGLVLFSTFALVILMGHSYASLFIVAIQIAIFREILGLKRSWKRERPVRASIAILWYIFFVGTGFLVTWTLSDKLFLHGSEAVRNFVLQRDLIFFSLYAAGFVAFVLSMREGFFRYQVRLFLVTHFLLLISLALCSAISVIYEGLIWFLTGAVVMCFNDGGAYHFGLAYGRTRLIALSPKKTVEGFIGGLFTALFLTRAVT